MENPPCGESMVNIFYFLRTPNQQIHSNTDNNPMTVVEEPHESRRADGTDRFLVDMHVLGNRVSTGSAGDLVSKSRWDVGEAKPK